MLDPAGVVITWNKGAERIKGTAPTRSLARHFSQFYPPEDVAQGKPQRELEAAVAEGRFEDADGACAKTGRRSGLKSLSLRFTTTDGKLAGFSKVTRDVSSRRKAEQKFKDLLEAAPDLIVIVNPCGKYRADQLADREIVRFRANRTARAKNRTITAAALSRESSIASRPFLRRAEGAARWEPASNYTGNVRTALSSRSRSDLALWKRKKERLSLARSATSPSENGTRLLCRKKMSSSRPLLKI